jgi:hypothetical protein
VAPTGTGRWLHALSPALNLPRNCSAAWVDTHSLTHSLTHLGMSSPPFHPASAAPSSSGTPLHGIKLVSNSSQHMQPKLGYVHACPAVHGTTNTRQTSSSNFHTILRNTFHGADSAQHMQPNTHMISQYKLEEIACSGMLTCELLIIRAACM